MANKKETILKVTVEPDMVEKVKYALSRINGVVKVEDSKGVEMRWQS